MSSQSTRLSLFCWIRIVFGRDTEIASAQIEKVNECLAQCFEEFTTQFGGKVKELEPVFFDMIDEKKVPRVRRE